MAVNCKRQHHENDLNVLQDNYDFESTLGSISDEILEKDLKKMLYLLTEVVPGREREKIKEAYEVFAYLKKRGLISEDNVAYLVNLLKDIKREDLAKKLKHHNAHRNKPYKCIIIGESHSGKTALALRLMYDIFPDQHNVTLMPDCLKRNIYLEEKFVPVEMWDTAGMEALTNILPDNFFRDVSIVVIVFDITDRDSFTKTTKWYNQVKVKCANKETVLLLVGNKLDRTDRVVSYEMGRDKATEIGAEYLEVSAKDGQNAESLLTEIASALPPENFRLSRSYSKTLSLSVSTQTPEPRRRHWRRRLCHC